MKQLLNLRKIISTFLCLFTLNLTAQPPNDYCSGAIDISEIFIGSCGDQLTAGPFSNHGATKDEDVFPPDLLPISPSAVENNYKKRNSFNGEERTVWFQFSVPDLNNDGSDVSYSLWMSNGAFNDNCGIDQSNILDYYTHSEIGIYRGFCEQVEYFPFGNSNQLASPYWISGWQNENFIPGETYFIAVNTIGTVDGEFCLSTVVCGVECNDNVCYKIEDYCDCVECQNDCEFGGAATIEYIPDNSSTSQNQTNYVFSENNSGNIFLCSELVNGFVSDNVYLSFGVREFTNCTNEQPDANITLSSGELRNTEINIDGSYLIDAQRLYHVELSPADLALGSLTINSIVNDGLGNICENNLTLNFADFQQATDPFCELTCNAGGIDSDLLNEGITVCEGNTFTISTNGQENLNLPCNSDDGSGFVYAWRVLTDLYGTGDLATVTDWHPLGSNPTIDPTTFFIDERGYVPPYFVAGYPITPLDYYTGSSRHLLIQGAALCLNADGTIEDICVAVNEGYPSSLINVFYLPDCGNSDDVWPGDTNNDGIVNQRDLALSGCYIGAMGPPRAQEHQNIDWYPHPAVNWPDNLLFNVPNFKHLDCDGDGVITPMDANAVLQNEYQEHNNINPNSIAEPPYFENTNYQIYLQPIDDLDSDNLLNFNVVLESKNGEDITLLGGYFTIMYPKINIIDAAMNFTNSWLGDPSDMNSMLASYRNFPNTQHLEVGFSKMDGINSIGSGVIGQVTFALDNNAIRSSEDLLTFEIVEIGMHNSDGEMQEIEEQLLQVGLNESNCQTNWTITEDSPFYNVYKSNGTIATDGFVLVGKEQQVQYSANRVSLEEGFSVRAKAHFKVSSSGCN